MLLSPECARVLGALVEKGLATPQQYPLTVNALQAACNQTSNREPVVNYDETTVLAALDELKDRKLVRFVLPSHGRSVVRYRQVLDETLALDDRQCAILAVLAAARAPDHRRAAHPDRAHGPLRQPRRDRARARPPPHPRGAAGRQRRPTARARRRSAGPRHWSPAPEPDQPALRQPPRPPAQPASAEPRPSSMICGPSSSELRAEVADLRHECRSSRQPRRLTARPA